MGNTIKCLDVLVETAVREQPDIILICGDIWHTAKIWSERSNVELRVAADYIDKLAEISFVVVLYGTPNHDSQETFNSLVRMCGSGNACFVDTPDFFTVTTKSGPIQIAGLPGFDKGFFRAQFPGLSAEEENQVFTQQLAQVVAGLSAQLDPTIPSVLMAHHTVVGCDMGNGGTHIFQANEVVLDAATLDNSAFDLVCLGHIHKAQRVKACSKPVFYTGSIDAFTFNDEGQDKGFWIHTKSNQILLSDFIATPAREFLTCRWPQEGVISYIEFGMDAFAYDSIKDKVVRVLYTCDSETEKALDKKKLERDLYAAGAYYVSEIRPESITAAVNREGMTSIRTVEDCLCGYMEEKKIPRPIMMEIFELVKPIIAEAQASAPMGSQSGLFLPVEIEVRNYRSYAEEKLSFEDIFFAMVNGVNGSGKSSLFMDAITDCLYEETREKELTGWIRNGEKSGSISFTFRLGDYLWRATRTRQRSGKATLALAKHVEAGDAVLGGFIDHSCERMVDTQEKIKQLLGMDCDTFQSCVLIMQDRYGKFMEASKEDRMAVLASLLGLGIYDDLSEITKGKLTDVNRAIRGLKDDITKLEESVKTEEDLHTDRGQVECLLTVASNDLQGARDELVKHQADLAAMDGYTRELAELEKAVTTKTGSYTEKKNKKSDLEGRVIETQSFLQNEQTILDKCAELDAARLEVAALDGKVQLLNDKKIRCSKLNRDLAAAQQYRTSTARTLEAIAESLKDRERLEKIVEGSTVEQDLEEYDDIAAGYQTLNIDLQAARVRASNHAAEIASHIRLEKREIESLQQQVSMLENSNCLDVERASCRFLQSAKYAQRNIESIETQLSVFEAETDIKTIELNDTVDSLINEISNLAYDTAQHEELKRVVKTFRDAKDSLAKLAANVATADALKKQDAETVIKIQEYESELQVIAGEIVELEKATNRHSELNVLVISLFNYETMKQQLPKAKQFVESTAETIKQLEDDMSALRDEIEKAGQRIDEIRIATAGVGSIRAIISTVGATIKSLENQVSDLNRQIGNINAKLEGIGDQRKILEQDRAELQQEAGKAANLTVLSEAFSQDGIPYQIIRDIVPELEAAANEILGQMTGGKMRLEFITEKVLKSNKAKEVATLEIIIIDADNGILPYLSRSGGQKVRAALANSFALAMIKASRVGLQLGMLFIDEPSFLDVDGIEGYCAALETIHNRYPDMRILAISHDENMKSRFPQQLYVDVTENGSKVRRSA